MERIVPWVPIAFDSGAGIVSERVVHYARAASTGVSALDQVALAPGSD
jgi:hypothetical protein